MEVDGLGKLMGIFVAEEFVGNLDKGRITEIPRAVIVGAAHDLGHDVQGLRGPAIRGVQVERLQHVQFFQEHRAAGAGGRRDVDIVGAAIARRQRFAFDGAVMGQIGGGD